MSRALLDIAETPLAAGAKRHEAARALQVWLGMKERRSYIFNWAFQLCSNSSTITAFFFEHKPHLKLNSSSCNAGE
jgi:hypothetical protein